ncbi:MAG: hypothetical protein Q4D24_07100, partial [Erysipelotrichaceae bacterium]|nr:hypothetical protein [Erysipelotrichaceae bacterium]
QVWVCASLLQHMLNLMTLKLYLYNGIYGSHLTENKNPEKNSRIPDPYEKACSFSLFHSRGEQRYVIDH